MDSSEISVITGYLSLEKLYIIHNDKLMEMTLWKCIKILVKYYNTHYELFFLTLLLLLF